MERLRASRLALTRRRPRPRLAQQVGDRRVGPQLHLDVELKVAVLVVVGVVGVATFVVYRSGRLRRMNRVPMLMAIRDKLVSALTEGDL